MKKRIFIAIQYLEIGGAERSLIGLLNAIDYTRCEVDLFVYRHTGEFMSLIPKEVNLLPEINEYAAISRPIKDIVREGFFKIALGRLWAKHKANVYNKKNNTKESIAIFQYTATYTTPHLPSLEHLGEYDLAISFLIPHNIVRDKVRAKKKWAWIHTDYSFVETDTEHELPVWNAYDNIISISEEVTKGFVTRFPSLKEKIKVVENILSEKFVREQAETESQTPQYEENCISLCTVGRFSYPKAIDRAVFICKELVKKNPQIRWYIVGYGGDEALIRQNIAAAGMEKHFILLGKHMNPYPFIKACDFYVQPSRYEGKAVTVREAQILYKPAIITKFPTSGSQLTDGIDGIIVPNNIEGAATEILKFISDKERQNKIIEYLKEHHYGNEAEVEKIYKEIGL